MSIAPEVDYGVLHSVSIAPEVDQCVIHKLSIAPKVDQGVFYYFLRICDVVSDK